MKELTPAGNGSQSLRLPAKATIYYMITSTLSKILGVVTTPLFTRLLTEEEYGSYTLYMSILGLVTIICSAFISSTVIYRGLEKFREEYDEFIFSAFVFGTVSSVVLCLFLFAFSSILGLSSELMAVLTIQIFCDITIGLSQTLRRYNYNYRALSITNAISVIMTPIISIIFILGGTGFRGRIYALLIVSLGICTVEISRILKKRKRSLNKKITSYIMRRTFPLLPTATSSAMSAELDKLMLVSILGTESLAKYSVAHTIGLGLGFAVSAVSSSLHPWVIRKLSENKRASVLPVFESLLISLSALGIGIALILPELFAFLAPFEYSDARVSALPLIVSTLPSFATSFITIGLVHSEKGAKTSYSAVCTLVFGFILNLILIPKIGYAGAALSHLVSVIISLIINYAFLKNTDTAEIFNKDLFIKIFIFTAAAVAFSTLTYKLPALRILLFVIPVSMLLIAYSGIKDLIVEG